MQRPGVDLSACTHRQICHAWRAGEKAIRATPAAASKESMEGTLLWDMRKDGGKDEG